MTRERIKDFKEIVLPFFTNYFLKENYENLGKSDAEEFQKDFKEIMELADKALDQESAIDKIRAEIEDFEITGYIRDIECFNAGIRLALSVIDKYRAESEDKE